MTSKFAQLGQKSIVAVKFSQPGFYGRKCDLDVNLMVKGWVECLPIPVEKFNPLQLDFKVPKDLRELEALMRRTYARDVM